MGKTAFAYQALYEYLQRFNHSKGFIVGLIIGQSSGTKDFIVHVARTPQPSPENDVKVEKSVDDLTSNLLDPEDDSVESYVIPSVKDIKEFWIRDHAKHVTRMLPGGLWVLGIFLVGENDPLSNHSDSSHIFSLLQKVYSNFNKNIPGLCGSSPSTEKLVVYVNTKTTALNCRSVSIEGPCNFRPVEWKFQKHVTQWQQINCTLQLGEIFPLSAEDSSISLRRQLHVIVNTVTEIIDKSVCTFDGETFDSDVILDTLKKKNKGKNAHTSKGSDNGLKVVEADLFCLMGKWRSSVEDVKTPNCLGLMNFLGNVKSRVFLHEKATVQEAVQAVKQDLVRSLTARLEMHLDSLIEEEDGSPEEWLTLHEPPRRVALPLPHAPITICDYLFPGEGPSDALVSSQELLDICLQETDVEKDFEVQADITKILGWDPRKEGEIPEVAQQPAVRKKYQQILYTILAISILVLILSLFIQAFSKTIT